MMNDEHNYGSSRHEKGQDEEDGDDDNDKTIDN